MESDNPISLSQQFPKLKFTQSADEWLISIKGKNLSTQLQERRITKICTRPLLTFGVLHTGEDGHFSLLINSTKESEQDAMTLGHEIGHTFCFDLATNPPSYLLPKRISQRLYDSVESFCEAFSTQWIAINGREAIELLCKKQRGLL